MIDKYYYFFSLSCFFFIIFLLFFRHSLSQDEKQQQEILFFVWINVIDGKFPFLSYYSSLTPWPHTPFCYSSAEDRFFIFHYTYISALCKYINISMYIYIMWSELSTQMENRTYGFKGEEIVSPYSVRSSRISLWNKLLQHPYHHHFIVLMSE